MKWRGILALLLVVQYGCSSSIASNIGATQSIEAPTSPPQKPPTAEMIIPTPRITEENPEIDNPVAGEINFECIDINTELPGNLTVPGSIILRRLEGETSIIDLVMIKNGNLLKLSAIQIRAYDFIASPYADKLAFIEIDGSQRNIGLLSGDGSISRLSKLQEEWLELGYWANDSNLVIQTAGDYSIRSAPPVVLLDTRSAQTRLFELDLPNLYGLAAPVYNWDSSILTHPSQEIIAYLALDSDGFGIRLWDGQEKAIMGDFSAWGYSLDSPRWAKDGSGLFFASLAPGFNELGHEDLFVLSEEGKVTRLTFLAEMQDISEIGLFSISPETDKLAFWQNNGMGKTSSLLLLDLHTHEVKDVCLSGYGLLASLDRVIWSPSGNYMLVTESLADGASRVVLVDLRNYSATILGIGGDPIGWLKD